MLSIFFVVAVNGYGSFIRDLVAVDMASEVLLEPCQYSEFTRVEHSFNSLVRTSLEILLKGVIYVGACCVSHLVLGVCPLCLFPVSLESIEHLSCK